MEHFLDKLRVLIIGETAVYGELLELSQSEKDAIIKNNIQDINAIVEKEKAALKQLKQLENERKALFTSFSEETGLKAITLRDISARAKGASGTELRGSVEKLESTAAELNRINKLNKTLIETQMRYSSFYLNLLTGPRETMDTYSNSGRLNDSESECRLLDQTI